MLIGEILLTERGIQIKDVDGSTVEMCGKDVWELLKWLNWHILEISQRQEMEGVTVPCPQPVGEKEKEKNDG